MRWTTKACGSLSLLVCTIFQLIVPARGEMSKEEILRLKWKQLNDSKIDEKLFKKMNNMHGHYYIGAVRGLLGAIGGEIYRKLPPTYRHELATCLNAITDEQDLVVGAKCVLLAYELEDKAKQTWVGDFAVATEPEYQSGGERQQQRESALKQVDEESTTKDSFIQKNYYTSSSSSHLAGAVTSGHSISNPFKVFFNPEQEIESETDNSIKETSRERNPAFKQAVVESTTKDSLPQRNYYTSPSSLYGTGSATGGRSIIRPFSEVLFNPDQKIKSGNSIKETWTQRKPFFKQANEESTKKDSLIQRNYHTSPSSLYRTGAVTNGPSIIKPISEVLHNAKQETESEPDNSIGETWRRSYSEDSVIKAFINDPYRTSMASKNNGRVWNAHSLRLRNPTAENRIRNSLENTDRVLKQNISRRVANFWREHYVPWRRLKRSPHRLGNDDEGLPDVMNLRSMPDLMGNEARGMLPSGQATPESPIVTATKVLAQLVTGRSVKKADGRGWKATSAKLDRLKKQLSAFQDINNPKPSDETYTQRRLYDIVTNSGNYHSKISKQELEAHLRPNQNPLDDVPLIKDALKLVETLAANNISQSARFLSPRIAPIMRQESKGVEQILSPSLFSFYRDDSSNNIASIPEILGAAGMSERDQDTMMELAMEISGARGIIDKLFNNIDNPKDAVGLSSDILSAVGRMSDVWSQFGSSFDDRQNNQMDAKGYTFMDRNQIEMFYGKDGLYNYTKTDTSKLDVTHLNDEQMRNAMRQTIRKIAGELPLDENDEAAFQFSTSHQQHRTKRQLTDVIGQPIILTPFAFAPTILKNTILGPTILSPNIFSPFIVNPQYFAPAILSPSIANPFILSPYLFGPFVLNPGVMVPFILSPYVLSPFILSPLVLTPFVLSPYVLSPNVLNPYVLSPVILNPTVLSPDILSSTLLSGSVLSPTVLSPAVESEYFLGLNVLSPSFLSRKKRNVHFKRRLDRLMNMTKM